LWSRSEEPKPESTVQEELTEQDQAAHAEAIKPQEPIFLTALRAGGVLVIFNVIFLLSQFVQGRISPNRILLDLIIGSLMWLVVGTLLGLVIVSLWRRKLFFFLFCVIVGVIVITLVLTYQ
jgi:hypothetical protein